MYNFCLAKAVFTFAKLYKKLFLAVTVTGLDWTWPYWGLKHKEECFFSMKNPN